jgi:alpha/beta superfamily hydrolase
MTRPAPTRLAAVTIPGLAGPLEGLFQEREGGPPAFIALVCHPHPSFGGTMHNKVVHRVATTLHALGGAVLRFNFRGVGASAGTFDEGEGELEDARAALAFLRARHARARCWVAGFSFGAWVAARLAASEPGIERMILVAPPVGTSSFEVLHRSPVPKHVFQGTADDICPIGLLERELPAWSEPRELTRVPGATHFFDRQLAALADAITQAVSGLAREEAS